MINLVLSWPSSMQVLPCSKLEREERNCQVDQLFVPLQVRIVQKRKSMILTVNCIVAGIRSGAGSPEYSASKAA